MRTPYTDDGTWEHDPVQEKLVQRGVPALLATDASDNTVLVGPDNAEYAAIGASNAIYVNNKAGIQAAVDSITDNLPVNFNTGTVSVTNGSPTITFSSAPVDDKVVAGRDLFTVDGSRWYRIKSGPTTDGGATFTLFENYQGSTDAAASFGVYKPNPRTIVLLPGVYDFTGDALAKNVMLKPYVGIVGMDRDACIIRRNKNNTSGATTPVVGLAHGCWLRNLTIDSTDGHFGYFRMGLTADATSQTQAMAGSFWLLDRVSLLNKDPNYIDAGADYLIDSAYFNGDSLLLDTCYFEHCWDGFTWVNAGAGRLNVTFNNPVIYKTPYPDADTGSTGATFIRAGVTGASATDILMVNPVYNQELLCAGEVAANAAFARLFGNTGMIVVGGGATAKILNPSIDMDVGLGVGKCAAIALNNLGGTGGSTLECIGGYINIAGAGGGDAADFVDGAANNLPTSTLTVCATRVESGKTGVRQNNAGATTNLQGGARIKGATNSLVNTAGTMNKSANVSLAGVATSGVITSAET